MNREEQFSKDVDNLLLKGEIQNIEQDKEYQKDLELAEKLSKLYSPKARIKEEVYQNMGKHNNQNRKKFKVVSIVALAIILLLPATNFGQGFYHWLREVTLPSGKVTILQGKENKELADSTVPSGLRGLLFDKDGNELTEFKEGEPYYNDKGEQVVGEMYDGATGKYTIFTEEDNKRMEEEITHRESMEEIVKEKLAFTPLLIKNDSYKYKHTEIYPEGNEKSIDATFIYEIKGKELRMREFVSMDGSGYCTGADTIEEVDLNGVPGIFYGGDNLTFERDGLVVSIYCQGLVYEDFVEIYESLQLYNNVE